MKSKITTCWMIVFTLILIPCLAWSGEMHTWTSTAGATLQARFLGVEGDQIILQPEEGAPQSIRINLLVPEDQVLARQLQAGDGIGEEKDDAEAAQLPALGSGPDGNQHAVYRHPHFVATVNRNGDVLVQPLANGSNAGDPFRILHHVREFVEGQGRHFPATSFVRSTSPSRNASTVSFEAVGGEAEPVHYEVTYRFEENQICIRAEILSPRNPVAVDRLRISTRFPAMEDITPQMPLQEIKKRLEDHELTHRHGRSQWTRIEFHASMSLSAEVDAVRITGPWGPRAVRIESDNRHTGNEARLWNYVGNPLYRGYHVLRHIEPGARPAPYCIRIE